MGVSFLLGSIRGLGLTTKRIRSTYFRQTQLSDISQEKPALLDAVRLLGKHIYYKRVKGTREFPIDYRDPLFIRLYSNDPSFSGVEGSTRIEVGKIGTPPLVKSSPLGTPPLEGETRKESGYEIQFKSKEDREQFEEGILKTEYGETYKAIPEEVLGTDV